MAGEGEIETNTQTDRYRWEDGAFIHCLTPWCISTYPPLDHLDLIILIGVFHNLPFFHCRRCSQRQDPLGFRGGLGGLPRDDSAGGGRNPHTAHPTPSHSAVLRQSEAAEVRIIGDGSSHSGYSHGIHAKRSRN